jgi:hypothetical protein
VEEIEESIKNVLNTPLIVQAIERLEKAQQTKVGLSDAKKKFDEAMLYRDQCLAMDYLELELAKANAQAKADQESAKLEEERQAAREYDLKLKPELRQAWLEAGGDPDNFEAAYPALKQHHIIANMHPRPGTGANTAKHIFDNF